MVKEEKRVRIYIEGGASGHTADADFRRCWKIFLHEIHDLAIASGYRSLEVVRGRGRGTAFGLFKSHRNQHPNDLCVLLVDSETEVKAGETVWEVVGRREGDKWVQPSWAADEHLYLMVVFVETWLLTDQEALQKFFKKGFNPKPLPVTELESRSKDDVEQALAKATKDCQKGSYRHGQAHEIIELVRPEKVRTLHHGARLFTGLSQLIQKEFGSKEPSSKSEDSK